MSYFDKLQNGIFLSKKYLFHNKVLSYLDIISNISFILTNRQNYLFKKYIYNYYYSLITNCISLTTYYSNREIMYRIKFIVEFSHSYQVKSAFSDLNKLYKTNKYITEKIDKYHNKKKNDNYDKEVALIKGVL